MPNDSGIASDRRVLLVDDDRDLVDLLGFSLRRAGYTLLTAFDGAQAVGVWEAEVPDLLLLDGRLPGLDGFDVCRRIRATQARKPETRGAIIFLTERTANSDVVDGLDAGADDYVSKPFSFSQLLARMQAVLWRYEPLKRPLPHVLSVASLVLESRSNQVTYAGRTVRLTPLEFQLLSLLALNAGHVLTHTRLINEGWGYECETTSALLKSHLTHIRKKLGLPRSGPGSITAAAGLGYRLTGD
jgi:DNA-binding response OmpR family regulator